MMIRRNMNKVLAMLLAASISMSNAYVPVYAQETVMPAEEQTVQEEIMTDAVEVSEETIESVSEVVTDTITESIGESETEMETDVDETETSPALEETSFVEVEMDTMSAQEALIEEKATGETAAEETVTKENITEETATDSVFNNNIWDGITTQNVYEDSNYRITFTLSSYWDSGYNAYIKIDNISENKIQNWYLDFDFNNSITNIWNAEIIESSENDYIIRNLGWNQDIEAGSSIEFGISGNEAFKGFPEYYELIGDSVVSV